MDSHHPVLPDTGGVSTACDRVDPGPVLHRAMERGLEEGKGTAEKGKGVATRESMTRSME